MVTPGQNGEEGRKKATIREVKACHEEQLLSIPGVVSVGIGKDPDGSPAIIVGLDGPRPETAPEIPTRLEGFRVRVEIHGRVRALGERSRRNINP